MKEQNWMANGAPQPDERAVANLVFLEFVDEAEAFMKAYADRVRSRPQEFKVISFHPLVRSYLIKHGIDPVDSFRLCGTASHQKLLVKLGEYVESVRRECRLKDFVGVRDSYVENLLFSIRTILATWLYSVEVVNNAVGRYRPRRVIVAASGRMKISKGLGTESVERYLIDIAAQVCAREKIDLDALPFKAASVNFKSYIIEGLQQSCGNALCRILGLFIRPAEKSVIAPYEGHEINKVLKDLRKELDEKYDVAFLGMWRRPTMNDITTSLGRSRENYRHLFYDVDRKVRFDPDFVEQRQALRKAIYALAERWSYRGVRCAKYIKLKYKLALERETIDKTYYQAVNLNRFLDRSRPLFVLSQHSRLATAVMGELCRLKDIPSLMIPHGSFAAIQDEYSEREWRENALGLVNTPYRYLALQTPLIEKFLRDVPVKSSPVITGPLILGRCGVSPDAAGDLRKRYAPGGEKIILHASTPKNRRGIRFINYETIEEYVDGLSSLVRAVDGIKGMHLVIRYRVLDGLSAEDLKGILPGSRSYSIASDGSFTDYLSIADLLVSYSSTTMEEALQNKIPVLLFNKYNRYQHIAGKELRPNTADGGPSAVYNVNSQDYLSFALEWILKNHLLLERSSLEHLFSGYRYKDEDRVRLSDFIKQVCK